jgi:hypothetical protein
LLFALLINTKVNNRPISLGDQLSHIHKKLPVKLLASR